MDAYALQRPKARHYGFVWQPTCPDKSRKVRTNRDRWAEICKFLRPWWSCCSGVGDPVVGATERIANAVANSGNRAGATFQSLQRVSRMTVSPLQGDGHWFDPSIAHSSDPLQGNGSQRFRNRLSLTTVGKVWEGFGLFSTRLQTYLQIDLQRPGGWQGLGPSPEFERLREVL